MGEKSDLVRRSEAELARNRDLSANLYDYESKARNAEESLSAARRDQDQLRFSNQSMAG